MISLTLVFLNSFLHTYGSSASASVAVLAPKYNFAGIGLYYLAIFIIGIVFLAFDIRARDQRERILETLDSRPFNNIDLVIGRFLGLLIAAWVPVVILVLIIQVLGWFLPLIGFQFIQSFEPFSIFSFPLFSALPAMAFCCAIVMLITLLVKQRFLALVISGTILVSLYTLSIGLTFPYAISSSLDLMGLSQTPISSDWISAVARNSTGWYQRTGILILAFGFLFWCALAHPRIENNNRSQLFKSAILTSLSGVALLLFVYQQRNLEVTQLEQWRSAHQEKSADAFPDVLSMNGEVELKPENGLSVELEIVFQSPRNTDLEYALFTLNPGFNIAHVAESSGKSLNAEFENGLLLIELDPPLERGNKKTINLTFHGKPDKLFGYLDSAIDLRNLNANEAAVGTLGIDNSIFESDYVALMPGIHWLPSSGVDVANREDNTRRQDFYELDFDVSIPANWIAAGPGMRTEIKRTEKQVKYRFSPQSVIPNTALIAAQFKSYTANINDIFFEVLVHPKHNKNFEYFAQGKDAIEQWIQDRLDLAKESGLIYPFRAFSLVEVPNTLRGYKGGWQMETAMAPPSMVLMKESGLATARFDYDPQAKTSQNDLSNNAKIIRNRIIEFYSSDLTGGNLFTGFARSFYVHQTNAVGNEAIALNYTLQQLTSLVLTDQKGYFSASKMSTVFQAIDSILGTGPNRGKVLSDRVINSLRTDEVWNTTISMPLDDIIPWTNPGISLDVLDLKAGGLAEMIYDTLGPDKSGKLLADIFTQNRGANFTLDDFRLATSELNPELAMLVSDWFSNTNLAGYSSDKASLHQLPNNNNGDIQYQLKVRVQNNEPVAGYARVSWLIDGEEERSRSEPLLMPPRSAFEIAVILSQAPVEVHVEPYLSLNRKDFLVKRFNISDIELKNIEGYSGIKEVEWSAPEKGRIIVDDLDPEFSVITGQSLTKDNRISDTVNRENYSGEIALVNLREFPSEWSRLAEKSAWAKYQHTLAFIRSGDGTSKVNFRAYLPEFGMWKLELHLPQSLITDQSDLGSWELNIIADNTRKPIIFNAKSGLEGWNLVGEYELPAGNVSVEFTSKTTGIGVIADAIAWSHSQ